MLVGEARDLGDALAGRLPFDAQATGQLVSQMGLVDVAGGRGVVVDSRVVEASPLSFGPGCVGEEHMGVQLRIAVARGAVAVGGGEVALALEELRASSPASGPARLALHVVEGGSYRFAVGGLDFERGDGTTQAPQQGDRLGR